MKFKIKHVSTIDSTNRELMRYHDMYENYSILSADHQTSGKGRLNRIWEDNGSGNLMFSILLKNVISIESINKLNYVVCASIISLLDKYGINSKFKWPNDVLVNNKKISGVLIETRLTASDSIVVIGQGINVNSTSDNIDDYIYISDVLGRNISKEKVLYEFVNNFKKYFHNDLGFQICKKEHCYHNKIIEINNTKYTVGNINMDGSIILIDSNSQESKYFGSELSLSKREILKDE